MADFPSSRRPSSADTYYFIPDIWSSRMIKARKSTLVCVGAFNTSWRDQLKVGEKVWIPVGSNLTAGHVDVTSEYGGNMNTDFGTTAVYITIDKWDECPVIIDDGTRMQTQIKELEAVLADNAGYQVNKAIDTDVGSLFSSLTSTWAGSDGQDFTDDLLISLMEGLDESDVPRVDRSLIGDPSVRADCFKIDKFVNRDYNMTLTGEIGKTPYGDKILITNNLTGASVGNYCAYAHTEAIGIAIQKMPKVEHIREGRYHSDVINVSAIWGSDVLRSDHGAYFYSRNS